jgi:hypothetical protein
MFTQGTFVVATYPHGFRFGGRIIMITVSNGKSTYFVQSLYGVHDEFEEADLTLA